MNLPQDDYDALTRLLQDDSLGKIQAQSKRFNFFDAVGMTNQEIRHSAFLAFLLDPGQSHGVGETFLRAFLNRCFAHDTELMSLLKLTTVRVRREWNNIDLLVESAADRLVVVIENKVWSGEHGDQLARYLGTVQKNYPGWSIQGIYLTPSSARASHASYCSVSYRAVVEDIEHLLEQTPRLETDAALVCSHYVQMVRRQIVGGSEVEALCKEIYEKHQHALDLLLRYRPDRRNDTHQFLRNLADTLIQETPGLMIDQSKPDKKQWVSFLPTSWLPLLADSQGDSWSPNGKMLFFVFHNFDAVKSFRIELEVRPGPHHERERLFAIARSDQESVLQIPRSGINTKWVRFYTRTFLTQEDCDSMPLEVLEATVRAGWDEFVTYDLPRMETLFRDALSSL